MRHLHTLREENDLALDGRGGRCGQLGQRCDGHDLRLEALRRRGAAAAQRDRQQSLRPRGRDLGMRIAPNPMRNGDGLGVDVLEAERAHVRKRPAHGAGIARAAGGTRTHLGGQRAQQLVCDVVLQGALADGPRIFEPGFRERFGGPSRAEDQQAEDDAWDPSRRCSHAGLAA